MAALRWDEQAQAYTESETPMKYEQTVGAWTDTTGLAWDHEAQAWTEKWGTQVSAYVYGAVSETVTIRKNGIVVATVQTDASGCSTEQITLSNGTYTLTGSVSGWTEEQTVNSSTTKFRAMPEGSIYWYGNLCGSETTYTVNGNFSIIQKTNYLDGSGDAGVGMATLSLSKIIDFSKYTKAHAIGYAKTFGSGSYSGLNFSCLTYSNNKAIISKFTSLSKQTIENDINITEEDSVKINSGYYGYILYAVWME